MKRLMFVTGNSHKYSQLKALLSGYKVELVQKRINYPEDKERSGDELVMNALKYLGERVKQPFFIEDTSIKFKAYKNFPGNMPKYIFNALGYKGIFKLLRGEDKRAEFVSRIGLMIDDESFIFRGNMHGRIILNVRNKNRNVLPYERIFMPEGYSRSISDMKAEEKLKFLHRAVSARKMIALLEKKGFLRRSKNGA